MTESEVELSGHKVHATASPVGRFQPERMNALTDGVFAIVLTLLVLELKLPEANESILVLIRDDARVFIAWLICFLLIARFWLVHHSVTAELQRCDVGTLVLNFGVLASVSLVPFSADIVGTERIVEPWSTVLFAGNVGLISLSIGLLARYALGKPNLLHPDRPRSLLSRHRLHHLYALPTVAMASALLAFIQPYLAVGIILLEFVVTIVLGSQRHDRAPSRPERTKPHASEEALP